MPKALNFQQIQVFKMVMETGTTTKAAIALNTTQPSVSRRLADLQRATGLLLFELYLGRLRPTREARQLYQSVCKHFDGLEKIETAVSMLRRSGAGVLRVGSTPTLAVGLLPQVINRFMAQHPGTFISLQTLGTSQLEEHLRQELIDVAITTGSIDETVFRTTSLMKARAVCIVPQAHEAARLPRIDLEALHRYRLILLNDADNLVIRMRELLAGQNYPDDIAVETNSSITICALVAAGVGIGVVNPFIARILADQFLIKELRPAVEVDVRLARSVALASSMLCSHFIDLLQQMTSSSPSC